MADLVNNPLPGTTQLWPLISYRIATGGTAQVIAYGPLLGGFIVNPADASAQGLPQAESIFVDIVNPAALSETATTLEVGPGQRYDLPENFDGAVWVNAQSNGHKLAGLIVQPKTEFSPSRQTFPPTGPTTITAGLPSYLYEQYDDDEDLQAFVDSYNDNAQAYIDWFVNVALPNYTGSMVSGQLLDWVAAGLYGMSRPVLPSGRSIRIGPYNTWRYNTARVPYNTDRVVGPANFYSTTDDVFKRILTWHIWKGDGKTFNVRWLKRRVMRFLTGTSGKAGNTDQTYIVSVTFSGDNQVNINLQSVRRIALGGAIYNSSTYNKFSYNTNRTVAIQNPVSPLIPIFKAAMDAGVLEVPFQYTFVVNI